MRKFLRSLPEGSPPSGRAAWSHPAPRPKSTVLGSDGVAHGCTGEGNDRGRCELIYRVFDPTLKGAAPWGWD